jgi:hypothetical protein
VPPAPSAAVPAAAEPQPDAHAILKRMAEFLGGTQRFTVNVRSGYDAVQKSGQKIEFGESRKITVNRPDRLRMESERSDGDKLVVVFDSKEIVLFDASKNVYATTAQPGGLDQAVVHFRQTLGMRLPLAPLLVSQLPLELDRRVKSVAYVEKTQLFGAPAHHLAARTEAVDFQVWIADGDKPLPMRVVLTYKGETGQPQYWAQFSDWNLAPQIADTAFAFKPPAGAQKIAFAAELARVAPKAKPSPAKKGAQP